MIAAKEIPLEERPGVIKVIKHKSYYTPVDIMELLGVSRSYAYKIVKKYRAELEEKKKISGTYPPYKVPRIYFDKDFAIKGDMT